MSPTQIEGDVTKWQGEPVPLSCSHFSKRQKIQRLRPLFLDTTRCGLKTDLTIPLLGGEFLRHPALHDLSSWIVPDVGS